MATCSCTSRDLACELQELRSAGNRNAKRDLLMDVPGMLRFSGGQHAPIEAAGGRHARINCPIQRISAARRHPGRGGKTGACE